MLCFYRQKQPKHSKKNRARPLKNRENNNPKTGDKSPQKAAKQRSTKHKNSAQKRGKKAAEKESKTSCKNCKIHAQKLSAQRGQNQNNHTPVWQNFRLETEQNKPTYSAILATKQNTGKFLPMYDVGKITKILNDKKNFIGLKTNLSLGLVRIVGIVEGNR